MIIVAGVEESPGSKAAARWAGEAASQLGARVVVAHAYEPLDHLEDISPGVDFADVRDAIAEDLETWCRKYQALGVSSEVRIEQGRPADVLIDIAGEFEADLLVVGARATGSVSEHGLGSTADQVIRDSRRPVVVVPLLQEGHGI